MDSLLRCSLPKWSTTFQSCSGYEWCRAVHSS